MAIANYKDLLVYMKSYDLSLRIHHKTLSFPVFEKYELGRQMRNASKSICSNLAEGHAKSKVSGEEFKRYIQISLGSSEELQVWLDYSKSLGYMSEDEYNEFKSGYQEISRMLQGLYRKWG